MKPGGISFLTYFLLEQTAHESIASQKARHSFAFPIDEHTRIDREDTPEYAVAYEDQYVRRVYLENGLRILEPVRYGGWTARRDCLTLQDVIIAEKI